MEAPRVLRGAPRGASMEPVSFRALLNARLAQVLARNERVNGEFYVCPVYNHLITAGLARDDDRVVNLDPVRINVPRELAARLPPWQATRDAAASRRPFTVSVQYGRHWEPWVVEIGQ